MSVRGQDMGASISCHACNSHLGVDVVDIGKAHAQQALEARHLASHVCSGETLLDHGQSTRMRKEIGVYRVLLHVQGMPTSLRALLAVVMHQAARAVVLCATSNGELITAHICK